jgi:hypothetical protein
MERSVRNVVLLSQLTLSRQLDPPGAAARAEYEPRRSTLTRLRRAKQVLFARSEVLYLLLGRIRRAQ